LRREPGRLGAGTGRRPRGRGRAGGGMQALGGGAGGGGLRGALLGVPQSGDRFGERGQPGDQRGFRIVFRLSLLIRV
jgi:hypothetical protein